MDPQEHSRPQRPIVDPIHAHQHNSSTSKSKPKLKNTLHRPRLLKSGRSSARKTIGTTTFAPTTKTTVVTTTTTTLTALPSFTVKPPAKLIQRDTRNYPLAAEPTPSNLQRFSFKVGNHTACFEEATHDDASDADIYEDEDSDSYPPNGQSGQTPPRPLNISSPSNAKKRAASESIEGPDTKMSLARPIKKLRQRKEAFAGRHRSPVTPQPHSMQRQKTEGRFADHEPEATAHATPISLHSQPSQSFLHGPSHLHTSFGPSSSPPPILGGTPSPDTLTGPPSPPAFIHHNAMVATPPLGDLDQDPSDSFASALEATPSLDTSNSSHTLTASLPSPLLSPVATTPSTLSSEDEMSADDRITIVSSNSQRMGRRWNAISDMTGQSPFQSISNLVEAFDSYPKEMQQYVMFQLLKRCSKDVLQFTAEVVNPALKCDFFNRLPTELSLNVIRYLDAKTLCRCAQVSKRWRHLVDTDEKTWRQLIREDGYHLPKGEVERAVREGWKWQGLEPYEIDLRVEISSPEPTPSPQSQTSLKRKAAAEGGSLKRRKTSHGNSSSRTWIASNSSDDSVSMIDREAATVNIPELGLKSLRHPHLYKSIYRRHHGFREIWMDKETEPHHIAFRAHGRHVVTCLQFDDDKILTGSDDTKIHVYNTNTGALIRQLDGHEGGVWALQYDGNTLVSGSTDRTVRVWDIEKGRCRHVFQGHTSTVRCLVILKPTVVGHDSEGNPIVMPKEPLIITGSRDSTLRIWSLPKPGDAPFNPSGAPLSDEMNPYFIRALTGHVHSVRAIAAHGDTLVSGSYDSTVRVWKISTGEVLHRLTGHNQKVYSVILDHERNRCISGSMDNLVKVWSLETGQCIFNLEGHSSLVGLLDLNTGHLVSAAADWTLRIWDPETGHCKKILQAHTGAITCFQHDAMKVVSGSDRTLKMWNIQTGEFVRDLLTDLSGGWQVKFNDRKCVAAVQRQGRTYIEVLDFGAARDGIPDEKLGSRILVDERGREMEDLSEADDEE